MTRIFFTIAAILLTGPTFAGSIDPPWVEPEVTAPATPTWTGAYAGLAVGRTSVETTRTTQNTVVRAGERQRLIETDPTYLRECRFSGSHNGQKCTVSSEDWMGSPEIQALDEVNNPWNVDGYRRDGVPGDLARYQSGYNGVWGNDNSAFQYTTSQGDSGDPERGNRGADNVLIETIRNFTTEDFTVTVRDTVDGTETVTREQTAYGAFAGYRHDFGTLVGGGEIGMLGDLVSAQATLGIDAGRALPYLFAGAGSYDGDNGAVYGLGVDIAIGERWMVGVQQTFGDFYETTLTATSLRAGIRF